MGQRNFPVDVRRLVPSDNIRQFPNEGAGTGLPPPIPPELFEIVTDSLRTTTGVQQFTAPNFGTPAAAIFLVTAGTTINTGFQNSINGGVGMTDGVSQVVMCRQVSPIESIVDAYNRAANDEVIQLLDGTGAVVLEANFSQWVTDGVEINVTVTDATAYLVTVILIDSSVNASLVLDEAMPNSTTETFSPGFESDAIICMATNSGGVWDTAAAHATFNMGFVSWDGVYLRQCGTYHADLDAVASVDMRMAVSYNDILNNTSSKNTISNITSTSFDVTTISNFSTWSGAYLCLKFTGGESAWAGIVDAPIATGDKTWADLDNTPEFIMAIFGGADVLNTNETSNDGSDMSIGFANSFGDEAAASWYDQDGSGNTDSSSLIYDTIANVVDAAAFTKRFTGSFVGMAEKGFTINFTDVDSAGIVRKWPVLGIGPKVADVSSDPYWHQVIALIGANGFDGSPLFPDESSYHFVTSVFGSLTIDTNTPVFGTGRGQNVAGAGLLVNVGSRGNIGSLDFTLEGWWEANSGVGGSDGIAFRGATGEGRYGIFLETGGFISFYHGTVGQLLLVNDQDYRDQVARHIAVCRSGGVTQMWINGQSKALTSTSYYVNSNGGAVQVCNDPNTSNRNFLGYFDEFRFTVGVARYSGSSFQVSSTAFPRQGSTAPLTLGVRAARGYNRGGSTVAYPNPPYGSGDLIILATAWTDTDGGGSVTSYDGIGGGAFGNGIRHNNYQRIIGGYDDEFDGAWQRTATSITGKAGLHLSIQGPDPTVRVETFDVHSIGTTSVWANGPLSSSLSPTDWLYIGYMFCDSVAGVTLPASLTLCASFVAEDMTCVAGYAKMSVASLDVVTWGLLSAQGGFVGGLVVPAGGGTIAFSPDLDPHWDKVQMMMGFNWDVSSNQAAFDASSAGRLFSSWNGSGPVLVNSPTPPFGKTWARIPNINGWIAWGTGHTGSLTPPGDFTMDAIFYTDSLEVLNTLACVWGEFSTDQSWRWGVNQTSGLQFIAINSDGNQAFNIISSWFPDVGSVYHARVDCRSGQGRLYVAPIGGVGSMIAGPQTRSGTIRYLSAEQFTIGGRPVTNDSWPLQGNIKEYRYTANFARTAGGVFTPVSSMFPRWGSGDLL